MRESALRGRVIRAVLAMSAVTAATFVHAAPASAHAIVQSTSPGIDRVVDESPSSVVMRFNEPVEVAFGAIRVYDTDAERVDTGEAEHLPGEPDAVRVGLEPDLAQGTYTVTWRVISADSHPIEEAFVFHVGRPGAKPQGIAGRILDESDAGRAAGLGLGVARWLNFAGLAVFVGAMVFLFTVWRRTGPHARAVEERFATRWERIAVGAWIALVVGTIASLVFQGAVAGDLSIADALSASVLGDVAETRFGTVALYRLAILGLVGLLWVAKPWRRARPAESLGAAAATTDLPSWFLVTAGAAGAALLVTPGLAGHAGTTEPEVLNVAVDAVHLLGVSAWIGGLVVLLAAAFPSVKVEGDDATATMAPVVARFSDLAVIAVAAIVVTGTYAGWVQVRALRALTDAPYGVVLLIKIGVFVPLLVLGAINNRWTKPRIERAARHDSGGAPLSVLRRLIAGEVALAVVVLAVTSLLVNLAPARLEAGISGPFIADVRLGENNLNVLVDPNEVGRNQMHLTVSEPSGAPVKVREMRVLLRMPSEEIGPLVADGRRLAPGHYVVSGRQLSVPGEWVVEVVARVGRFEEERTRVTVTVNR
jgi:copper transport protein